MNAEHTDYGWLFKEQSTDKHLAAQLCSARKRS